MKRYKSRSAAGVSSLSFSVCGECHRPRKIKSGAEKNTNVLQTERAEGGKQFRAFLRRSSDGLSGDSIDGESVACAVQPPPKRTPPTFFCLRLDCCPFSIVYIHWTPPHSRRENELAACLKGAAPKKQKFFHLSLSHPARYIPFFVICGLAVQSFSRHSRILLSFAIIRRASQTLAVVQFIIMRIFAGVIVVVVGLGRSFAADAVCACARRSLLFCSRSAAEISTAAAATAAARISRHQKQKQQTSRSVCRWNPCYKHILKSPFISLDSVEREYRCGFETISAIDVQ